MVANTEVTDSKKLLNFGLMASVKSIPDDQTELKYILAVGDTFDDAFNRWGIALRKFHGKNFNTPRDVTTEYLGYWTDNGAYYYYKTLGPNITYEDTLIKLNQEFQVRGLPMKYVEIDSWWYFKGPVQGVTSWTPMPELFPHGLDRVQQETGWPVGAHNRYWSGKTNYSSENGGDYYFIIEKDEYNRTVGLPQEAKFWFDLMKDSKKWGLEMYEQDWLDVQYLLMNSTHEDFYAADNWLTQMGYGAKENGIFIKYCMALPRHILSSSAIDSVNAARTSGDYRLSKDNWRIGLSGLFSNALGLHTFKDSFWSNQLNPDHPFYYECMIGQDEEDPNVPWSVTYRYNGYKSVSKSGKECISWYDTDLHFTAPNNDLERNACRNAANSGMNQWGEGRPWCFTNASLDQDPSTWQWESCDIPVCNKDCRRGNSMGDNPNLPECMLIPEPNPEREAVVSLLSNGGVGPGDKLELLDPDIIMPTCNQDGKLLMADLPAKATPVQILNMAFSQMHNPRTPHSLEQGELWITQTTLMDYYVYPIIFMSETQHTGYVSWKQLGLTDNNLPNVEKYIGFYGPRDMEGIRVIQYNEEIPVPDLSTDEYKLLYLSPVWRLQWNQVALLGEIDKYVHISNNRIKRISIDPMFITMKLSGSPGEKLRFGFATIHTMTDLTNVIICEVILGPTGEGQLLFDTVHVTC